MTAGSVLLLLCACGVTLLVVVALVWLARQRRHWAAIETEHERLLELADIGMVTCDPGGAITRCNPAFAGMLDRPSGEVVGRSLADFSPTEDRYLAERMVNWPVREEADPHEATLRQLRPNGDVRWLRARSTAIRNTDDRLAKSLVVFVDTTEQRAVGERLRLFSKVFMDSADPILIEGLDGTILDANHEAQRRYGFTLDELIGQSTSMLIPPQRHGLNNELIERLKHGQEVRDIEGLRWNKRKEVSPVLLTLSILKDEAGEPLGFVSIAKDITDLKLAEASLKRERDSLERRVASRTRELEVAMQRAEEASQAKADFLANMSHEIRTPMNAVIGLTELSLRTQLDPQQKDYLGKIESSARNLLGIINDILDFSKIDAGKLAFETVDFGLHAVLDNLATVVGPKAGEKGLELLFDVAKDTPHALRGDPMRLGQVLINLGNNAVKFTESGHVRLRIRPHASTVDTHTLRFEIEDTGIGMTPEQLGRLFKSFSQADSSTSRKYGGTGLGLVISKRLVEMMKGTIEVSSETGAGSVFSFTARFDKGTSLDQPREMHPDLANMRALVVDDNEPARIIFRNHLEGFGFDVDDAADGSAALQAIRAHAGGPRAYQFVLSDLVMPGVRGNDLARTVRDDANIDPKPVLIIATAHGREALPGDPSVDGIARVLLKPVMASTLLDSIMGAFGFVEEQAATTSPGAVEGSNSGARLLLVEDNKINQQVARELLKAEGFLVTIAENGREALQRLDEDGFDGVLMDVQMPVMDGYTATREIRSQARFADLPIIAMTANAMAGDRELAIESGMNDHVAKPINVADLMTKLEHWVKRPATEDSA